MEIEKPYLKKEDGRKNNGGARENSGRNAFEPTEEERKQVEAMSGYGVPLEQIAILIRGIHIETLSKYFSTELTSGKAKANAQIGRTLFQKAVGGDTTAAIFWAKTQMRWKDTTINEHTGSVELKNITRTIIDGNS